MASLHSLYIKIETLETLLKVVKQKVEKGVELTISVNDEANEYQQNVSAFVSQTKEQREAGKAKYYAGNGRTFWTDGKISVIKKEAAAPVAAPVENDLPF